MPNLIYSFDAPFSAQDWRPINDGVMGGVSFSEMQFDVAGHAVFQGNVSLQNGAESEQIVNNWVSTLNTAKEKVKEVGAEAVVSACPWCKDNFTKAVGQNGERLKVFDISELILASIGV